MTEALSIFCYLQKKSCCRGGEEMCAQIKAANKLTNKLYKCVSLHENICFTGCTVCLLSHHLFQNEDKCLITRTKLKLPIRHLFLSPSPISSFYGLFCKALKIYKIKLVWGFCLMDYFSEEHTGQE